MKRWIAILLCLLLVLSLFGCKKSDDDNTVSFYYCRAEYDYGEEYGVVAPEQRELSEHATDLSNLLTLYLVGPLEEHLASPFTGTKLISVNSEDGQLFIRLADTAKSMTDARFTLACACMTMTCLELVDAEQVTIYCGDRTVTMSRDSLLLYDSITPIETAEVPQ